MSVVFLRQDIREACPGGGKSDFHTLCLLATNSWLRTWILRGAVSFIKGIFRLQQQMLCVLGDCLALGLALTPPQKQVSISGC